MKICFWGNIARALDGKTDGGGELQTAFIAKSLVLSGHEVIIVDYNTMEGYTTPEGIRVVPIKGWNRGVRVLRTISHRLPGLYSTLKSQNADIYYCRIRDFKHIIAWWVSRKIKAKFILHMASDLDAMNFNSRWKNYYMAKSATLWWLFSGMLIEIVYPFLLKNADLIIAQHSGQKNILQKKNIDSVILLNIIDISLLPEEEKDVHKDFIYVGWLDKRKGFPDFYKLVESVPDQTYRIVGAPRDDIGHYYFSKLKEFCNVSLKGELSHYQTLKEISRSRALISTSPSEGFPNVFIEAWAYGIPVISLNIDPGSVIDEQGLGVNAHGDLNRMIQALKEIPADDEFAARARKYVENNHALNSRKIAEINKIFTDLRYGKVRNS
jgi:glycosyltransferase involved in cell wall biosynthesis